MGFKRCCHYFDAIHMGFKPLKPMQKLYVPYFHVLKPMRLSTYTDTQPLKPTCLAAENMNMLKTHAPVNGFMHLLKTHVRVNGFMHMLKTHVPVNGFMRPRRATTATT